MATCRRLIPGGRVSEKDRHRQLLLRSRSRRRLVGIRERVGSRRLPRPRRPRVVVFLPVPLLARHLLFLVVARDLALLAQDDCFLPYRVLRITSSVPAPFSPAGPYLLREPLAEA
ncbi:unnamed protein product [Musa hybrid cultivar]